MSLLALINAVLAAVFGLLAASGLLKRLPNPALGRATFFALALVSAVIAVSVLLSNGDSTGVVSRAVYLLSGTALAAACLLAGRYVMTIGTYASERFPQLSDEQLRISTAVTRWTGLMLICISLVFVVVSIAFAIYPP